MFAWQQRSGLGHRFRLILFICFVHMERSYRQLFDHLCQQFFWWWLRFAGYPSTQRISASLTLLPQLPFQFSKHTVARLQATTGGNMALKAKLAFFDASKTIFSKVARRVRYSFSLPWVSLWLRSLSTLGSGTPRRFLCRCVDAHRADELPFFCSLKIIRHRLVGRPCRLQSAR